jgi:CubicO group peptidase (beta-lactamase class C family)
MFKSITNVALLFVLVVSMSAPTRAQTQLAKTTAGSAPQSPQRKKPSVAATQAVTAGAQPTFDRKAFEDSLHAAVAPNVMGYTFLLIKDGRVAAEGAGGLARNAADGKMKMTTSTPQNLGSLFKFITGVTVVHLLDRPPQGSAGGANSFQTLLGAQVVLLYPQLWSAGIKTPGIRSITFRHLLQHRSGFRNCSTPLGCFGGAYDPTLLGKRDYENINFSLLGYLIPLYATPSLLPKLNGVPKSVPADERDADMQLLLGDGMDSFMRQKMFPLAPGKISASCDAANEYKATGAYGYVSRTDTGKGIITSRKASNKPCSGAGGYWMSIRDFGSFVAAALHSDRMLSLKGRLEMYRTGMPADDRLVWSFTTTNSWVTDKFKMPTIIWSNGIQPYATGQSFNTVLLRLPLNYELMIFVNSGGMGVNSLASAGLKAFRAGMEP